MKKDRMGHFVPLQSHFTFDRTLSLTGRAEEGPVKPNQTESNRIKPNQTCRGGGEGKWSVASGEWLVLHARYPAQSNRSNPVKPVKPSQTGQTRGTWRL